MQRPIPRKGNSPGAKIRKAERKAAGENKVFPEGLPRRILSYPKIVKAERKAAGENEVFPEGLPRRILSYSPLPALEKIRYGQGISALFQT